MAGGCAWLVGCAWLGGMHGWGVHGRGACMVGGVHGRGACVAGGMHGWVGGVCGRGACMVGGQVWQGGMHATHVPPPPTLRDTVGQCAAGMHPTGMHSCYVDWLRSTFYIIFSSISLSTCSVCLSGFSRSYLSMHHIGPFMGHNRQYSF